MLQLASTRCTEERKLENLRSSHEGYTTEYSRVTSTANAYFERGHVVSPPCNIRGGGIGANNGTPAPATKQHSAGTTSSALSTGPQFVSVLLHNTRCGAVTRMRDEVLRCLITPPPATILPCRQPFEEKGGGKGDRIGEQRLYARGIRLKRELATSLLCAWRTELIPRTS